MEKRNWSQISMSMLSLDFVMTLRYEDDWARTKNTRVFKISPRENKNITEMFTYLVTTIFERRDACMNGASWSGIFLFLFLVQETVRLFNKQAASKLLPEDVRSMSSPSRYFQRLFLREAWGDWYVRLPCAILSTQWCGHAECVIWNELLFVLIRQEKKKVFAILQDFNNWRKFISKKILEFYASTFPSSLLSIIYWKGAWKSDPEDNAKNFEVRDEPEILFH